MLKENLNLNNETDWNLVKLVRNDASSEAFNEISHRYQDVFYKICHRYSVPLNYAGIYIKDIFNDKNIILLYCINTFKRKKKTKLSSWIANHARYLCLNAIKSKQYIAPFSDNDIKTEIEEKQDYHEYYQNNKKDFKEKKDYIFNLLGQLKDPRIKEIFQYRYFSDKKMIWNKIAKKVNISPQTAMTLHQRGIALIKSKLMNNDFICDTI